MIASGQANCEVEAVYGELDSGVEENEAIGDGEVGGGDEDEPSSQKDVAKLEVGLEPSREIHNDHRRNPDRKANRTVSRLFGYVSGKLTI